MTLLHKLLRYVRFKRRLFPTYTKESPSDWLSEHEDPLWMDAFASQLKLDGNYVVALASTCPDARFLVVEAVELWEFASGIRRARKPYTCTVEAPNPWGVDEVDIWGNLYFYSKTLLVVKYSEMDRIALELKALGTLG